MQSLISFWADSRGKVILVLLLVWLAALLHYFQWSQVIYPVAGVIAVSFFDWIITRIRNGVHALSLSSVITGLLIGLILDPGGGILLLLLASFLAVIDKQFARIRRHRHIFNPAAFGIVAATAFLPGNIAWWAVSWGIWPVVFIGLGMLPILLRLRRLMLPCTFLIMYFFLNVGRVGPGASARLLLDGTVFLFAFIMLPEPMTSLARGTWQYVWGVLVGILLLLFVRLPIPLMDPLLTALLAANAIGFVFEWRQVKT